MLHSNALSCRVGDTCVLHRNTNLTFNLLLKSSIPPMSFKPSCTCNGILSWLYPLQAESVFSNPERHFGISIQHHLQRGEHVSLRRVMCCCSCNIKSIFSDTRASRSWSISVACHLNCSHFVLGYAYNQVFHNDSLLRRVLVDVVAFFLQRQSTIRKSLHSIPRSC